MFEKEAEEVGNEKIKENHQLARCARKSYKDGFQDGATFGYNKANEWHYMKDGIMPEENQWVLVYDGSYTVCNYHSYAPIKWLDSYENEVYEGYIIAWKEITPPKEVKENEN